jgi:hypothetical protein
MGHAPARSGLARGLACLAVVVSCAACSPGTAGKAASASSSSSSSTSISSRITTAQPARPQRSLLPDFAVLSSVACPAAGDCIAVGALGYDAGFRELPLAERLTGSHWSTMPLPDASSDASLASVSCPTPAACVAVGAVTGSGGGAPSSSLVETWNGSSWRAAPGLSNGPMTDVSCTSATDCLAIGEGAGGRGFAALFKGASWRSVPPPQPFGPHANTLTLDAVLCRPGADCVVAAEWQGWVGSQPNGDWTESAFFRLTPQGWILDAGGRVHGPGFPGDASHSIDSISCFGSLCEGVGSWHAGMSLTAFVESDGGAGWTSQSFPEPPAEFPLWALDGVSCASESSCIVVGGHPGVPGPVCPGTAPCPPPHNVPLSAVLEDGRWRAVSNPDLGSDELNGVACTSVTYCVAVGDAFANAAGHSEDGLLPPVELWNGTTWARMRPAALALS